MCRSRPCSGGYVPRRGGLPRRCGFEGLQARNADGLRGLREWGTPFGND